MIPDAMLVPAEFYHDHFSPPTRPSLPKSAIRNSVFELDWIPSSAKRSKEEQKLATAKSTFVTPQTSIFATCLN